jgi:precorrin-2 dehydrogenase / sirohydrochlorin ferrochelatase
MPLYPATLQLTNRLCLVIGGGPVALRKARGLLEAGATVRVISPEVVAELSGMAGKGEVEWIARGYAEGDLAGAFLVFAATDNRQVQAQIAAEAGRYRVLLNSADDPRASDFHVPAHFRRGRMLVTVSTGGGSPALARLVRRRLEEEIVAEYGAVVELLELLRVEVLAGDNGAGRHGELFQTLLDQGLVGLVLAGRWFELQMLLLRELPAEIDAVALMKRFLEQCDS